jgi:hypothetical protein
MISEATRPSFLLTIDTEGDSVWARRGTVTTRNSGLPPALPGALRVLWVATDVSHHLGNGGVPRVPALRGRCDRQESRGDREAPARSEHTPTCSAYRGRPTTSSVADRVPPRADGREHQGPYGRAPADVRRPGNEPPGGPMGVRRDVCAAPRRARILGRLLRYARSVMGVVPRRPEARRRSRLFRLSHGPRTDSIWRTCAKPERRRSLSCLSRHSHSAIQRIVEDARRLARPRGFAARVINRVFPRALWIRPNGRNGRALPQLLERAIAEGRDYVQFMVHSSEFMPGGSPTFRSPRSVEGCTGTWNGCSTPPPGRFQGRTLREYHDHWSGLRSAS